MAGWCLLASPGRAQSFLGGVDNDYPGNSFNSGDVEAGGFLYGDANLTVGGSLYSTSFSVNQDLHVGALYLGGTLDQYQDSLSLGWGLELWSGFSPGMDSARGVGSSWFHSGLDLGDLTYTYADTPAFNLSEYSDGANLYPAIYFTGYDASTTWTWQENGAGAEANADPDLRVPQMELNGNGQLTVHSVYGGASFQLSPANGSMLSTASTVRIQASALSGGNVAITTGNMAVVFHGAGNSTPSITPGGVAALYANGALSLGFGNNVAVPGANAFAFGNNVAASYYDSIVLGYANQVPAATAASNLTTWQPSDPLLVVGNGGATDPFTVYKNGTVDLEGATTFNGNVTLSGGAITFSGNVALGANSTAGSVTTIITTSPNGDIPLLGN